MMSGRSCCILFAEQDGNALVNQPDQPERHGQNLAVASAFELNSENPALDADGWQLTNENNASLPKTHVRFLPRSNTEQPGDRPRQINGGNDLIQINVPFLPAARFERPTAGAS